MDIDNNDVKDEDQFEEDLDKQAGVLLEDAFDDDTILDDDLLGADDALESLESLYDQEELDDEYLSDEYKDGNY